MDLNPRHVTFPFFSISLEKKNDCRRTRWVFKISHVEVSAALKWHEITVYTVIISTADTLRCHLPLLRPSCVSLVWHLQEWTWITATISSVYYSLSTFTNKSSAQTDWEVFQGDSYLTTACQLLKLNKSIFCAYFSGARNHCVYWDSSICKSQFWHFDPSFCRCEQLVGDLRLPAVQRHPWLSQTEHRIHGAILRVSPHPDQDTGVG